MVDYCQLFLFMMRSKSTLLTFCVAGAMGLQRLVLFLVVVAAFVSTRASTQKKFREHPKSTAGADLTRAARERHGEEEDALVAVICHSSQNLFQSEARVHAEEIAAELQDLAFMEGAAPTAKAVASALSALGFKQERHGQGRHVWRKPKTLKRKAM